MRKSLVILLVMSAIPVFIGGFAIGSAFGATLNPFSRGVVIGLVTFALVYFPARLIIRKLQ